MRTWYSREARYDVGFGSRAQTTDVITAHRTRSAKRRALEHCAAVADLILPLATLPKYDAFAHCSTCRADRCGTERNITPAFLYVSQLFRSVPAGPH